MDAFSVPQLLSFDARLKVLDMQAHEEEVMCRLATTSLAACCPKCHQLSRRVHSQYVRHLCDVPLGVHTLHLELCVRKFFCDTATCPRHIFAERLDGMALPYARCTQRLAEALTDVACELGGEAGARMAARLHLRTCCAATMLNFVRRVADPPAPTPRVLGVDDWAWRKGHTYGTILCDLERHCVIDLLPDRESATLVTWLQAHPGIEIVCRDRANAYAQGARLGAPNAVQIADRFHLLVNLSDFLKRLVERHHAGLRVQVVEVKILPPPAPAPPPPAPRPYTGRTHPNPHTPSLLRADAERRRQHRAERYEQIRQLHSRGYSRRRISRELDVARNTIRRALSSDDCPEHGSFQRRLKPFLPYLTEQCEGGERNARKLYRDIQTQGYTGSYNAVALFVAPYRQFVEPVSPPVPAPAPAAPDPPQPVTVTHTKWLRLPTRQVAGWLADICPDMTDTDREHLDRLCQQLPDLALARTLATDFKRVLLEHQPEQLADWIARAQASQLPEFVAFAQSLLSDKEAVWMAAQSNWSSGQVEGQVNRLKLIKRQMFGRGKLDLLRKRVLHYAGDKSKPFT